MKILLIRRAVARGAPGALDAKSPPTPSNRVRFSTGARGLARIVGRIDVLMTSPLSRARETAEITAAAFTHASPVIESALAGDRVEPILTALSTCPREATVALVGHEPSLGVLLARMVGSANAGPLAFKKGGAAFVDLPDGPTRTGRLLWFVPPRALRALGRDVGRRASPTPGRPASTNT